MSVLIGKAPWRSVGVNLEYPLRMAQALTQSQQNCNSINDHSQVSLALLWIFRLAALLISITLASIPGIPTSIRWLTGQSRS